MVAIGRLEMVLNILSSSVFLEPPFSSYWSANYHDKLTTAVTPSPTINIKYRTLILKNYLYFAIIPNLFQYKILYFSEFVKKFLFSEKFSIIT